MPSLDARSRSSRTRIPFEKIPLAFNPLKFLAMSLIEKNQQRKELELQKNMNEFAEQNTAAYEKAIKLELENQSMNMRPLEYLHEIAETEDEDAQVGTPMQINVDVKAAM